MLYKTIILSALFIAQILAKGPCDQKLECYKKVFEASDRALCSGFKGCARAEFGTVDYNPICVGAEACRESKITTPPAKMLCNGFKACYGIKRGIEATEKIACNGLKACREVVGKLEAPMVTCDGDIACNNKKLVATGTPPPGLKNDISCNGNKACVGSNLISDGTVNCDGDSTCKGARIEANQVGCAGKRSCYDAKLFGAAVVYGYGFNGAANSKIYAPKQGKKSKKKWTFEVRALGMNAMLGATINTQGAKTTILGYGYRSMVGSITKCVLGSQCDVTCRSIACKDAAIFVDGKSDFTIDPIQCDPRDPLFVGMSKRDPTKPGKFGGVNCPTIRGPGARLEDADVDIDELAEEFRTEWENSVDYIEMVDAMETAERALDAMIAEKVAVYEDNLDLTLPMDEEEEYMVIGHTISSDNKGGNVLASNILTALIVFIMTCIGSLCYIAYKFGGNGETKKLLQ